MELNTIKKEFFIDAILNVKKKNEYVTIEQTILKKDFELKFKEDR